MVDLGFPLSRMSSLKPRVRRVAVDYLDKLWSENRNVIAEIGFE